MPASPPFFRISFANATVLSAAYLGAGALVELLRRVTNARWAESLGMSLEAFPARILDLVGLLAPLQEAYAEGRIEVWHVRGAYGVVAVALIFFTGVLVGSLMWGLSRLSARRSSP